MYIQSHQRPFKKIKGVPQDPLVKQLRIRKHKDIVPGLSGGSPNRSVLLSQRFTGMALSKAETSPALNKEHGGDTH